MAAALHTSASLKMEGAPTFESMRGKLDDSILQAVKGLQYDYMTPVQDQVLSKLTPLTRDCLVQAKTGTGKTAAFLLPALQNIIRSSAPPGQVSVLILSPTRELALQIAAEAEGLVSKFHRPIEIHTAFGGTARATALNKFRHGKPTILVATPGRLIDYMSEPEFQSKFRNLKALILDEADRMLDQGFLPAIMQILKALPSKNSANGHWQGMCFSATIPPKMTEVLSHVLSKDHVSISTIDKSEPPTIAKVPQFSVVIPAVEQTFSAMYHVLETEIRQTQGPPKIIVFGTTANLVALYAKVFARNLGLKVYELHSRLSQPARTRTTAEFKDASSGIMFASDVIGRGMDFPDVSLVLQVGLPADADSYTHRVGRTARAGKDGRAIILLTERESFYLKSNRQFPINPYPDSQFLADLSMPPALSASLANVDADVKRKAYSAYMGFMKTSLNKMRLDAEGLVQMANTFALEGMLCAEVPPMEKKTIGKMGLKGVRGINYATGQLTSPAPRRHHGGAQQKPPMANGRENQSGGNQKRTQTDGQRDTKNKRKR